MSASLPPPVQPPLQTITNPVWNRLTNRVCNGILGVMPRRHIPITTDEIYHVFNRSIARQPIFLNQRNYHRVVDTIRFYTYLRPPVRFSHYNRMEANQKQAFLKELTEAKNPAVKILAFCIMPNHFHFLIKQLEENGISNLMRNFQHSYSKYFNLKNERSGSLFQSMYKLVRIETDEQLLHVSRYIHLNPVSSSLIKISELRNYPWSSFPEYMSSKYLLTDTKIILDYFKSPVEYYRFVHDQADYQKRLDRLKHLTLE